jgi:hypothetical protein
MPFPRSVRRERLARHYAGGFAALSDARGHHAIRYPGIPH